MLDPFTGGDTTLAVCVQLERAFIGLEADAKHAEIARQRLATIQMPLPGL